GSGGEPVVHCCAPAFPIQLVRGSGAAGVAVDLDLLDGAGLDQLAAAIEAGARVLLGAVPTSPTQLTTRSVVDRVSRLLDMLGLEPTDRMAITPACGLAGADGAWVRTALTAVREAASAF